MRFHLSLLLCFSLIGCDAHLPKAIPQLPPHAPLPDPPASTLAVNTRVVLTEFGQSLNTSVPGEFDTNSYCALFGLACVQGYLSREPIRLNLRDGHVRLDSMVHYQVDGNFLTIVGSCGRPDNTRRRMGITYDVDLALAKDWGIRAANPALQVQPFDSCKVTLGNVDVTGKVTDVMKRVLGGFTEHAQAQLTANTSIRDAARSAWRMLSMPIAVDPSSSILFNPQSVSVSPIKAEAEVMTARVAVRAKPTVVVGGTVPSPPASDLPPLEESGSVDDRFRLMPLVRLPFDVMNQALGKVAVGKEYSVPGAFGPRRVSIKSTSVTGSGDRILVGLVVDGDLTGTVWVIGNVDYRPADRIATIQITDLDVITKDFLVNVVKWVAPSLFLDLARSALGDYRFDVGQRTAEFRERARQALNREISPGLFAETQIEPVELRGPFSDASAFVFTAFLEGRFQLDVRPAGAPISTGKEIRYVSVYFQTSGDDKDAEEPVTLTLIKDGRALVSRQVGASERWGDSPPENQGPYFLTVPIAQSVKECGAYRLRVRKEPAGSSTGKGWKNSMEARIYFSDGTEKVAARSGYSQWGDGDDHPFDRTFGLCG